MIEYLQSFDFKDILFLILSIFGIVLTIYTFRISLIQKKPIYDIESNKLFENKLKEISELKTFFNNEEINSLTSTKIAFWNGGYQVINKSDIAEKNPIMISADNGSKILKINLLYITSEVNNIELLKQEQNKNYLLQFDYLAKNEGCTIEVLHTGGHKDISLRGTIKGSPKLLRSPINRKYKYDKFFVDPFNRFTNFILFLPSWLFLIKVPIFIACIVLGIIFVLPKILIVSSSKFFIPKEFIFKDDYS